MADKSELASGVNCPDSGILVSAQKCECVGLVPVPMLLPLTFNVDLAEPWHRPVEALSPSLPLLPGGFKESEKPRVEDEILGRHRPLSDVCSMWFQGAWAI